MRNNNVFIDVFLKGMEGKANCAEIRDQHFLRSPCTGYGISGSILWEKFASGNRC